MKKQKRVAIHQPNFFPWLGFFNKIARSDIFLILDNVQFSKTGGTWSNRVKLLVAGEARWVTMPIRRNYSGTRSYLEIEINNDVPWRNKMKKTIQTNYGQALYFNDMFPLFEKLINNPTDNLVEYNTAVIQHLVRILDLDPNKLMLGSNINADGKGTDLLVSMVRSVGGDIYMSGGGSKGYQEDRKFKEAGIGLIYQQFEHPKYPQFNLKHFIPGLSIIDALMNCGVKETRAIIVNDKR